MPPKNEEAPAAVGSSGEGGYEACTYEATAQKLKRKLAKCDARVESLSRETRRSSVFGWQ